MAEGDVRAESSGRVHALDGLRGVAASMVVLHHLGATEVSVRLTAAGHRALGVLANSVGASGVELFFVLSGVVLLRPYLRSARPFNAGNYLARRAQRLMPPYLTAWLVAGLTIYLISAFPTWWTRIAARPEFHLSDWLLQLGIVYFGRGYNYAWWSLTLEVLFYLLVPLLLPAMARVPASVRANLALLVTAVVVILLCSALVPSALDFLPKPTNLFLQYASCFVGGLVLAKVDLPRAAAYSLAAAGVVIVGAAALHEQVSIHPGFGLIYTGIVSRGLDRGGRLSAALDKWHLIWFGERSYSLFLIHVSVLELVYLVSSMAIPARGPVFWVVTRLVGVPLALLAAMIIFSGVEQRFARGLVTAGAFWPWKPRPAPPAP